MVSTLGFQCAPEALLHGIVVAASHSAHAGNLRTHPEYQSDTASYQRCIRLGAPPRCPPQPVGDQPRPGVSIQIDTEPVDPAC